MGYDSGGERRMCDRSRVCVKICEESELQSAGDTADENALAVL